MSRAIALAGLGSLCAVLTACGGSPPPPPAAAVKPVGAAPAVAPTPPPAATPAAGPLVKPGDTLGDGRLVEIGADNVIFSVGAKPGSPSTNRVVLKLAAN